MNVCNMFFSVDYDIYSQDCGWIRDVDLLLCVFMQTRVTLVPEDWWVCAAVSLTPRLSLYICIFTTDIRMSIKQGKEKTV